MSNKKCISSPVNNYLQGNYKNEVNNFLENKIDNSLSLQPILPYAKIKSSIFPNNINLNCPLENKKDNHEDSVYNIKYSESNRITDTHRMNILNHHHSTDKSTFMIDFRGNNQNKDQLRESDILFSLKKIKTKEIISPK